MEAWKDFESSLDENVSQVQDVLNKMPRKMNKKRMTHDEDGNEAGFEEYVEYLFPDDAPAQPNLKLLQAAQLWKKRAREETA